MLRVLPGWSASWLTSRAQWWRSHTTGVCVVCLCVSVWWHIMIDVVLRPRQRVGCTCTVVYLLVAKLTRQVTHLSITCSAVPCCAALCHNQHAALCLSICAHRYFLDNVAGWILELDRGAGIPFEGNYSEWLSAKEKRLSTEAKTQAHLQKVRLCDVHIAGGHGCS